MTNTVSGTLAEEDVRALLAGRHWNPFSVLGMHSVDQGMAVRAFLPGALSVDVLYWQPGETVAAMQCLDEEGLFEIVLPRTGPCKYRLAVSYPSKREIIEDPYRFASVIAAGDLYLFHEGRHESAYRFLGSNHVEVDGVQGILFAVWAPNASSVSVVGDFNNWNGCAHPMRVLLDSGIWELFIPSLAEGLHYKYVIHDRAGKLLPLKADPYCRLMEEMPGTASKIASAEPFHWHDQVWLAERASRQRHDAPITIYELHPGSWRRKPDGNYYGYRELADELIPYVQSMGFSHIQLMPVNEHPFGGSWGYQPVGMYAPTSRFGTANDFRYLVDTAHQAGIGILLDWVPGHFPTDEHGLGNFDGTHLYEHEDPRQGFHPDWNTYIFNYGRPEVVSYLLSNAMYWLEDFHIDGLRFDAVASMLYLDYSREEGQWLPNQYGGRENIAAIELLRLINTRAYGRFPDILMIAEESTAWPGVTQPVDSGGLGFGFKWNLGWMNDTLSYMRRDPIHRQYHHNDMTFGLLYAFSENFILPLSHDEVVHGKASLLEKMPGDDWQKFANLRAYLAFMWGHPGKKLLFMGSELALRDEWNHDRSLDWHLLEHASHQGVQQLLKDLNRLYHDQPALWSRDNDPAGFEWITAGNHSGALFIFIRKGRDPQSGESEELLVVSNFTPTLYEKFRFGVQKPGTYIEHFNSNSEHYGGTNDGNAGQLQAEQIPSHGRDWSLSVTIPPLATLFLKLQ